MVLTAIAVDPAQRPALLTVIGNGITCDCVSKRAGRVPTIRFLGFLRFLDIQQLGINPVGFGLTVDPQVVSVNTLHTGKFVLVLLVIRGDLVLAHFSRQSP